MVNVKRKLCRANPSARYTELLEQYTALHKDGDQRRGKAPEETYPGDSLVRWVHTIRDISVSLGCQSCLDYGAGKAALYQNHVTFNAPDGQKMTYDGIQSYWGLKRAVLYDPCVPGIDLLPTDKVDLVVCTDVLEHIPLPDIEDWLLEEIFSLANKAVVLNVACYTAQMLLPNGENAHCTVIPPYMWVSMMDEVSKKYPDISFYLNLDYKVTTPDPDGGGQIVRLEERAYTNLRS